MEAVPRLPMISFQLKVSPEPTTFGPKLKQYIRDFYNEDPESYNNEIHQLETLRVMVARLHIDMAGCLLLKKYYCQLHFLQSRFPMGKDGAAAVTFTWRDTYANMVCSLANIRFEIISILYNIGAMHTQLGARTERTSAEGMKMACTHFQCAAWSFEHLKNSYPQPSGVDLAPELMTFMHQLCLAQAQECLLEKSMLDNRKPTIVAKVARQIVDYYTLALTTLEQGGSEDGTISDTVGTKIYKSWKRYVKFKKTYHLAVTHLYQGLAAEEQRKMGERVAFYNAALASLNEAHSIYTNAKGSIGITGASEEKAAVEEALTFTNDVIEGKRKAAKNENEFIYHEEVPEKEALPIVKGAASLVKGISFSINDPEVSGPDIFARLVPMKVHEASSLYSEEKAKLLRSIGSKIEEKDQQLNTYLASLKLEHMSLWDPDIQSTDWERLPLPDDLVERCAALNAKPQAFQELVDIMAKLSDTSQDVEKILKEIKKLLLDEELKEKQYQDAVGKRPPSIVATDLTREAKKYEEAHNKATESNNALQKAINMHVKNLKILGQPLAELVAYVPSPTAYFTDQNSEKSPNAIEWERMHTNELKRILGKVDEMRRQRNELHTKLRDAVAQDDLTRLLVTATSDSGPLDRLFADQLGKHQTLVNLIEQNLAAQDNILTVLTDAYAQTANVRKGVEETLKRRELTISSLIASYDAYEDLLAKSSKGLEFYRKLEINVSKLLQRVKSTCKVQEEEREHILAQDNKNSQEKIDPAVSTAYDPARTRTTSGLKLKDYLNSRTDGVTGHQTQYYNIHKHARTVQVDGVAKPYGNDALDKTAAVQPSSHLPSSEPAASTVKPVQHYYPTTYTDYKNLPYNYPGHGYSETGNAGLAGVNQAYMQPSSADVTAGYGQHPAVTATTAEMANTTVQYPGSSFVPNGQPYPTTLDGQEKYVNAQLQYNVAGSNALQYEPYQPAMNYPGYNVASQYGPSLDKNVPKSDLQITPQAQSLPQTSLPTATTAGKLGTMDGHGHVYPGGQQGQQYAPDTPQNVIPAQEAAAQSIRGQHMVSDGGQIQGYTLPQTGQPELPSGQGYTANVSYYTPPDLHQQPQQQPPPICQSTTGLTNVPSSQYIPTHYTNSVQSVQPTASTGTSMTEVSAAYPPSTLQNPGGVQYQKPGPEQKYLPYGPQVAINNSALSYPSTYQTVQPGTTGLPYQPNAMLPTEATSSGYNYNMNCPTNPEIIQSHAKPTTVQQSYSQPYQQYTQQGHYSGYVSNYSYGHGYNYAQAGQMTGTISEPYKAQAGYAYDAATNQYYQYDSSGVQTSQQSQAPHPAPAATMPESTAATNGTLQQQQQQQQQESNARYTNASNNTLVSQTPSSQYSTQAYPSQSGNDTYYTTPYGLQMQGQGGTAARNEGYSSYSQTYMQAVNNGTSTTTSTNPTKATSKPEEVSNVDLLADLDVTINHAPLVPELRPLSKTQAAQEATSSASNPTEEEKKEDKQEKIPDEKQNNTQETGSSGIDDRIENEDLRIVWDTWYNDVQPKKDPLGDPAALQKFISEVEKYEKFVDSLLVKTLSGATNLDIKWKEVQDFEERESGKHSCTVALAHSSENRVMDCIPYDTTRVQISATDVSSSYINASHVLEITQFIPTAFIITQTPLQNKLDAFWTMVWEQETEVIACLASDAQLNGEIYWPVNEENVLTVGNFTITLKKKVYHVSYVQRVISIHHTKKKTDKTVVHMQFLTWPSTGFPSSPGALLTFSTDVMSEQALRRCSPKPVIVHCSDGGSLSSLFLVAAATVCHIRAGCGIVDVPLVFKGLIKCRKQAVNKESLLFAYRLVLYHAQDILMKRGILSSTRSTFENFEGLKGNKEKAARKLQCHPSDDFLQSFGVGGAQRSNSVDQQGNRQKTATNSSTGSITSSGSISDKPKEGTIDPLSQLDPLWSIRR